MLKHICEQYAVNEEQARALDININTALRAGAGSGKTRVLTKRFMRMLLENSNINLDNIVAITFTQKAAAEMKDRIRRELADKINETADDSEKKRLSNFRMNITNASIGTIHSFCGNVLRDNFAFAGIDPQFKIIEDVDRKMLLAKTADEVISEFIENEQNSTIVNCMAKNFSTAFFKTKLKRGILDVFEIARGKGCASDVFFKRQKIDDIDITDCIKVLEAVAGELIICLDSKYREYKQRQNMLDFNDLEMLTENLLQNDDIRNAYFDRLKTIMVDEFQDVNPLQKRIIDLITQNDGKIPDGKLFIVGDHKQSIYGFRGSDYRVFEKACSEISNCGKVEFLKNCYRSTPNIINGVNSIFEQLLTPYERLNHPAQHNNEGCFKSAAVKNDDLNHPAQHDSTGRKVELITWSKHVLNENKEATRWNTASKLLKADGMQEELAQALYAQYDDGIVSGKRDYQGGVIASVIQKLVSEGFEYKDIAILLRSRTPLSDIENSLINNQIPYCVLGGIGFWDRQEVRDILALYKTVFFSDDKLSLFTVLRSPIFGFSDDLLLAFSIFIRNAKSKTIDGLLTEFIETVSENDKWLVQRAIDIFRQIAGLDGILNSVELLNRIIKVTAYDEVLTALPQGEKKLRNIEKLIRIVDLFELKGFYNAKDLVSYIDVLKESSGMEGEAFLDNEDSDAVKILTIHAAKGLEFKAVLIPDMDGAVDFQNRRNKPLLLIDEGMGLHAMGLDDELEFDEKVNPEYQKLYEQKLLRELEDSRRLFYVAATRAKEYLGFTGESKEVEDDEELCKQNSFMKQVMWAMKKIGCVIDMDIIDAAEIVAGEQREGIYPPPFIEKMKKLAQNSVQKNEVGIRLQPCRSEPQGNISISSWMKYMDCPRKFYIENIAGIEDEEWGQEVQESPDVPVGLKAADIGTIVHDLLKTADADSIDRLCSKSAGEIIAEMGEEITQHDKKLLERCIDGFCKIENQRSKIKRGELVASLKEFGFNVAIAEGLNLTGFVDRIDIYEKDGVLTATIIDYKTNRIDEPSKQDELQKYYEPQLLSYAWALNQLPIYKGRNVAVDEAVLYFLHSGEVREIELKNNDMDKFILELADCAPALLSSGPFEEYHCKKTERCIMCGCKRVCEYL